MMRAVRVHAYGGPDALVLEEIPRPRPGRREVLVRVEAVGVGPWDAWLRSGRAAPADALPLIPGSDIAGVVEDVGAGVDEFRPGDRIFGATNRHFTGGYAEFALASPGTIAHKPDGLDPVAAAAVPVPAVTAWQMLFDHARIREGQRVLIHGGAGAIGAYAVQIAKLARATVTATGAPAELEFLRRLGADRVIDTAETAFETVLSGFDSVIDTAGGTFLTRSYCVLKTGGVLVTCIDEPDHRMADMFRVHARFACADVTAGALSRIRALLDAAELAPTVGEVLPLDAARAAHEMLEGRPRKPGKIVLRVEA